MLDQRPAVIVVDIKRKKIRIFRKVIYLLRLPHYIMLLVNPAEKTIAINPSGPTPTSHPVKYDDHNSYELCSLSLSRTFLEIMPEWHEDGKYRLEGKYIEKENIIVFDMRNAVMTKGKKDADDQD